MKGDGRKRALKGYAGLFLPQQCMIFFGWNTKLRFMWVGNDFLDPFVLPPYDSILAKKDPNQV